MNTTVKSSPRDVFLYLLAIVTLYIGAVSFGALLFQYVNYFFPDPLIDAYQNASGSVRWAIAALVIVFPVYVWISWFLNRDALRDPEKRELRIRRWLIYFTLFLAAIIIITDLVVLIYNFLGGELSGRFVLKVFAVLFIAATVFGYYLWDLRRPTTATRDAAMRMFVWAVIAIVAVSTIGGFFLVGSPFAERMRRFDEQRIGDLQNIQWQIVSYWQRKEKLPASLEDLRDPLSGFMVPIDPNTGATYEYRALGGLKFELCATFEAANQGEGRPLAKPIGLEPVGLETWPHGIGRTCFERTIDPELYPPTKDPRI